MKVKLLRDMERLNPEWSREKAEEARTKGERYDTPHTIDAPAGTEIEHPDAWRLVVLGHAEPIDEEATRRAGMTPEQIQKAFAAQSAQTNAFEKKQAKAIAKAAK